MFTDRPQAQSSVQIDNARVRVTEWRFAPGAETGWHVHDCDYLVVPQSTGKLDLETLDGHTFSTLESGVSYYRERGVEHNVINPNDEEFVFVEIELK
ncbi:cupin domain-containing protein [Salinicola endophyticus]|uniref:Cupin domain-containing protein n=1 Tax=Salinicola endophyticus TaxID=1949083 RepID=A0AB74UDK4_9GAMM